MGVLAGDGIPLYALSVPARLHPSGLFANPTHRTTVPFPGASTERLNRHALIRCTERTVGSLPCSRLLPAYRPPPHRAASAPRASVPNPPVNQALGASRTPSRAPGGTPPTDLRRLIRLTGSNRALQLTAATAALAAAISTALQGLLLGPVLRLLLGASDAFSVSSRVPAAVVALTSRSWVLHRGALLCLLAFTSVFRALFTAIDNAAWPLLAERVALALRLEALRRLLRMPLAALDALPPGVASARVVVEPHVVGVGAAAASAAFLRDGLSVFVLAVLAAILSPTLFVVSLTVWPLVALGLVSTARGLRLGASGSLHQRDVLATWAALLPAATPTVTLAGARAWVERKAHDAAIQQGALESRRALISAVTSPTTELLGALGVVAALALLRHPAPGASDRTVGFFYILFMAYRPLKNLGTLQLTLTSAGLALDRLNDLAMVPTACAPPVAVQSVSAPPFVTWRGSHRVTLPTAIDLEPGHLVAITGASGVGKSTLLEALAHLRPTSPAVHFNGPSETHGPLLAGFSPQFPPIFPVSVTENLLLGSAPPDNLQDVTASVGLDRWIASLAQGPDTVLGPGGVSPSAGERQRIGLARALLTHSPMVFLDEPTAGLDPDTAARVRATLRAAADGGRAVLAVTHDPPLAALADRVIAL